MDSGINTGVGGFGTQGAGTGSVGGVGGVSGTPQTQSDPQYTSTIDQSQLEALMLMLAADFPILIPPQLLAEMGGSNGVEGVGGATVEDAIAYLSKQTEQRKHDIINSMWDKFIETVSEIAKRDREADLKRETVDANKGGTMSAVQYELYLKSLSSSQRDKEIEGPGAIYNDWMKPAVAGATSAGNYPDPSFISGCAACSSPDAIRAAIGADGALLGIQLSVSPVADALAAVGPSSGLPLDYQAAAAMIAAMMYNGAVYKATADNLVAAVSKGQPPETLDFAVNYAQQVMAIVTKNVGSGESTNPRRAAQNNMVRLMMSAMALNLLYRAAYGGMSGVDMASLLNGGSIADVPDENIRALLGSLIGLVNSYLPKNPTERAKLIAELSAHVDSKESAESMVETTNLFAGLLNTGPINTARLASSGG